MSNISSLVNVDWFLGLFSIDGRHHTETRPVLILVLKAFFDDSTNWHLDIVQRGQEILGDRVLGFQAGNEPDLYFSHGRRNEVSRALRMSLADPRLTRR